MLKKLLRLLFVGGILLVLLAGTARTLFFPREINEYENRYAEKIAPLTAGSFLDGTFQESVDAALSDQVHFSQTFKKLYNTAISRLQEALLIPLSKGAPDRYISFFSMQLFGGTHLTFYTRSLDAMAEKLDLRAENYNQTMAALPDTEFYLYFIEKDTDLNFATGEKVYAYEYLRDRMDLPSQRMDSFTVDNFEDFSRWFYRTDHHWNHLGSYRGYLEVRELLGVSEPALEPLETVTVAHDFIGSKARTAGSATLSEDFTAYRFDYPEMGVTVNGQPAVDYGDQETFLSGRGGAISYGYFYGTDMGEVIFDTGSSNRGNLLILGESFDNAIIKLLASHFDRTFCVDLRYYEAYMEQPFVLESYLADHGIDQVLLIGNIDFFVSDDFRLEG